MPKNDLSTIKRSIIRGHPKCFKCERHIKCAVKTKTAKDYWECPWGLVFRGGGNYGSGHYDSMINGIVVEVLICDECLVKYKKLLREIEDKELLKEIKKRKIEGKKLLKEWKKRKLLGNG